MNIRTTATLALTALAGLSLLSGCESKSAAQAQLDEIRSDPSPSVDTLAQSHEDIENAITVTNDTNLRSLNRDLGVFFLLDRPSRLSPYPIR